MNILIAIIQLFIFLGYILYISGRFGILPSISESTYRLERNKRFYFTLTLWAVAILNYYQPMGMYGAVASIGLFFTGVTIAFKNKHDHSNLIHYIGASVAIFASLLGLIILYDMWLLPIGIFILSMVLSRNGDIIWWFEIASILFIILGYIFI